MSRVKNSGERIAFMGLVILVIITSFLTYNIGKSGIAYACTCATVYPPEDAIAESTAVFSGKVIEIRDIDQQYYQAVFDVEESWKGIEEEPVIITTATSGDFCGYGFEIDKEYLVYAHGQTQPIGARPDLGTGICTRTAPISSAEADLLVLGEGKNWTNVHPVTEFESTESYDFVVVPLYWLIGIPLAIIGAIIGGIIGIRRWKRKK